jgi:hypothetical protein
MTVLSASEVSELVAAIAKAEARLDGDGSEEGQGGPETKNRNRIELAVSSREDFPLPTLGPKLLALAEEAKNERGFALIRGFPVERLTRRQSVVGYWGIGLYW